MKRHNKWADPRQWIAAGIVGALLLGVFLYGVAYNNAHQQDYERYYASSLADYMKAAAMQAPKPILCQKLSVAREWAMRSQHMDAYQQLGVDADSRCN